MSNRITVDSDEFERMKKDIKFLKNERSKEKLHEYDKNDLLKYDLDDKERKIFEYIKSNPGCNKQDIIDHFKTIPGLSRNPTFGIINSVIKRQYIIEERDRHNKNSRRLFINEKNIIVSVSDEMENFRNRFLGILNQLNLVLPNLKNEEDKKEFLSYIDQFYTKFITIYVFRAIPAFTNIVYDKQTLHELYRIIINNIISILVKYYEFGNPFQKLLNIPYDKEICTDDEYDREIELFSSNGLQSQIVSLIKGLDSINFRYGRLTRVLL